MHDAVNTSSRTGSSTIEASKQTEAGAPNLPSLPEAQRIAC